MAHAVAVVSLWGSVGKRAPKPEMRPITDTWVGTTVSVIQEPTKDSTPLNTPDSAGDLPGVAPNQVHTSHKPTVAASPSSTLVRAALARDADHSTRQDCEPARSAEPVSSGTSAESAPVRAPIDLKQAMRSSLSQPNSEGGTFGAAGIDLRERRLPKALTRALPVAIGAEPGWYKRRMGTMAALRFQIELDEVGKIQQIHIEDEATHAFQAGIVRRVVKLLALGTFALSAATTSNNEQNFELTLMVEQHAPDPNSTADSGDIVEKGFEAPMAGKPGQAIIRDAPGHVIRAVLRVLPPKGAQPAPPETSHAQ